MAAGLTQRELTRLIVFKWRYILMRQGFTKLEAVKLTRFKYRWQKKIERIRKRKMEFTVIKKQQDPIL